MKKAHVLTAVGGQLERLVGRRTDEENAKPCAFGTISQPWSIYIHIDVPQRSDIQKLRLYGLYQFHLQIQH
jgi:hypothetical protein